MCSLIHTPLVLLDFDGTLAHLNVDWDVLKKHLARYSETHGFQWEHTQGLDANLRKLRESHGEKLFRACCTMIARAEVDGFTPDRVNHTLLELLCRRGQRPVGIVSSNTHAALKHILHHPVWGGLSPVIIGKEDVEQGKPHPEGLLKACEIWKIPCNEAVYVGNTQVDCLAAQAAGIPFRYVQTLESYAVSADS